MLFVVVVWIVTGTAQSAHALPSTQLVLRPSDSLPVIGLSEALARAKEQNRDVLLAKETLLQQEARLTRAWSAYLPKLVVDGTLTFNFPEIKVALVNGAQNLQQARLYDSVADLLELTQSLHTDIADAERAQAQATQLHQAANELQRMKSSTILINPGTVFDAKLTLTQPIFNAEAIMSIKNSSLEARRGEKTFKRAQSAALIDVSRAYFEAVRTSKLMKIADSRHSRAKAQIRRVTDKYAVGFAKSSDVQRLKVEEISANEESMKARANHEYAVGNLGLLIGEESAFLVNDKETAQPIDTMEADDRLIERALATREDLKAQQLAVKVAEQSEWQTYASFLPTINAVGQGKYTSNTSGFVNKPLTGAILLQASIPLFDGGDRYGRLRENRSKVREEKIKLKDLERRIDAEIRGARAEIELKKNALHLAQQALTLQHAVYTDTQTTFQSGLIDISDVIDINQRLSDAEVVVENAALDLELARLELAFLVGA